MHLVVTIDTEEDNWGDYSSNSFGIENIKKIPSLQKLFDEYHVTPTYLVTYPVATNRESSSIMKSIHQQGKCEIGTHCHPWNTPPFEEERNPYNSMLCNLPYDLQRKKIRALHEAIEKNFGIAPKSFRAGRWGYNGDTARVLREAGYQVDTSVTALTDWTEYHGPDYSAILPEPYRFNAPEIFESRLDGELMEIPASIGYLQDHFERCGSIDRILNVKLGRMLRLKGILHKLNLLNKVWLSPETSDARRMIALTKVFVRRNCEIVNMFFHSTSLQAGLSHFVKTKEDESRLFNRLRAYLSFAIGNGLKPVTLSEAVDVVKGAGAL